MNHGRRRKPMPDSIFTVARLAKAKRHNDEPINMGLNALDKVGAATRSLRSSPTPLT
jgi:hypothetical protein